MSGQTPHGRATVRQQCQAFGISRAAYYAARTGRTHSPARAVPLAHRRPRWASVAALEPAIRQCAAAHPAWGVRKGWATLRRPPELRASYKRIWALMHRWGLVLAPPALRDPQAPRGTVCVPQSNRRWASDLTTVWTRQDGWVAVIPVVDCGDRSCLELEASQSQESTPILAPVEWALVAEFGSPAAVPAEMELRTDHGPQFTGGDGQQLCDHWGLHHTLAPVGRPTGNAVAERLILTLKQELLWTRDWESPAEVRQALPAWRDEYNHRRPHQALGWRTPTEQRALNLGRLQEAAA